MGRLALTARKLTNYRRANRQGYSPDRSRKDRDCQLVNQLRMAITPYYASLMDPNDLRCPIRIRAVPIYRYGLQVCDKNPNRARDIDQDLEQQ